MRPKLPGSFGPLARDAQRFLAGRALPLVVESQQVVLREAESADGCLSLEAAVRSMPVVAMHPDRQVSFSMI
jgi:hypothetical protein